MQKVLDNLTANRFELVAYFDTRNFDIALRAIVLIEHAKQFYLYDACPENGGMSLVTGGFRTLASATEHFSILCLRSLR